MSIGQVFRETGISSLRISLIPAILTFLAAYLAGRFFKMNRVLTILVGFWNSHLRWLCHCGRYQSWRLIALSISTIFFFNILAIHFPFLGHLQMSDAFFGTPGGTAINDTSSVVAAGCTYSPSAGDLATIVKLSQA